MTYKLLMQTTLLGVVYDRNDPLTDFTNLLDLEGVVLIYNENFEAYCSGSIQTGAGNASIRKYRYDVEGNQNAETISARVLGIPTGHIGRYSANCSDQHESATGQICNVTGRLATHQAIIDDAIDNVINLAANQNLKYIIYSIDPITCQLGLGIFSINRSLVR